MAVQLFTLETYSEYTKDLRFSKSTISFTISTFPNCFFMGVYVYPIDSHNYEDTDCGSVVTEINDWLEKGYVSYIGGDFNSRLGNINEISEKSLKWTFSENIDRGINSHRKLFSDVKLQSFCR